MNAPLRLVAKDGRRLDPAPPRPDPEALATYQRALVHLLDQHRAELRAFTLAKSRRIGRKGYRQSQFRGVPVIVTARGSDEMQLTFCCGPVQVVSLVWPCRASEAVLTLDEGGRVIDV